MVHVAIMMNNLEYRVKWEHEMQSYSANKRLHKDREMMPYLQSHDAQGWELSFYLWDPGENSSMMASISVILLLLRGEELRIIESQTASIENLWFPQSVRHSWYLKRIRERVTEHAPGRLLLSLTMYVWCRDMHVEIPHIHTVYIFITWKITKQHKNWFYVNRRHKKQTLLISYIIYMI